jgi:hypothetical protein
LKRLIQEWGLSLEVKQVVKPGDDTENGNGLHFRKLVNFPTIQSVG